MSGMVEAMAVMVPRTRYLRAVLSEVITRRTLSHHEKREAKQKNIKVRPVVSHNKGPLGILFYIKATFTPVGQLNDWFTREVADYMWCNIAFDITNLSSMIANMQRRRMALTRQS